MDSCAPSFLRLTKNNSFMGKPRCTQELIDKAVQLKKTGAKNKDICAYIGIAEATFYRWCNKPNSEKQREFGESLKKAEPEYKAALRSKIMNAANDGSWQAAAWLLERLYPDEYGRKDRVQAEAKVEQVPVIVDDVQ